MTTYPNLSAIRKKHAREKIVFCSGSFDLTHAGHALFLEDCKKSGDVLVVAVGNDIILKEKGRGRPIMNEHIRLKMIGSLRPVDYAFIHKHPKPGAPFLNSFLEEIFERLRPDIWIVNTDAGEIPFRKALAKKYGIKLRIHARRYPAVFGGISTTKIIEKIQSLE